MLRELVDVDLSPQEVGDALTMLGFELEEIAEHAGEPVLDVGIMSNRGDGASVLGLARELSAKLGVERRTKSFLHLAELTRARGPSGDGEGWVRLETPYCSRYAALVVRVPQVLSPSWLTHRLECAGIRPIHLLVDLTNYVMLEIGQPLHAFDRDRLAEHRIVVRQARPGEVLKTLDGVERALTEEMMVIADAERPVAVAGVMGGEESEVTDATRIALIESAFFDPRSVRRTRKALGLHTEASYRFERGADPAVCFGALLRFEELLRQCVDGPVERLGALDVGGSSAGPRTSLSLRPERARAILAVEVTGDQCRTYLEGLGFEVATDGEELKVTPPSWRHDIEQEDDLVEEIGRIHGYEYIPETLPTGPISGAGSGPLERLADDVRALVLRLGFQQVMTQTLGEESPLAFPEHRLVEVRNPIAPESRFLRNSVLPGLAEVARRNGGLNLRLFEIGRVFVQGDFQIDESIELGLWLSANRLPRDWANPEPPRAGFFDLKKAVETLLHELGVEVSFVRPLRPDPRFHPSRQASILTTATRHHLGIVGELHPDRAAEVDASSETCAAEIDLTAVSLEEPVAIGLRAWSRNPAVRRDIAVVVSKDVAYAEIEARVRSSAGPSLERLALFDIYEGPGVEAGHRSLGIALTLRKFGENLTDQEANEIRDRVLEALAEVGARARA